MNLYNAYTNVLKCRKFNSQGKQCKLRKYFLEYLINNLYTYVLKCRKPEPKRKSEKILF